MEQRNKLKQGKFFTNVTQFSGKEYCNSFATNSIGRRKVIYGGRIIFINKCEKDAFYTTDLNKCFDVAFTLQTFYLQVIFFPIQMRRNYLVGFIVLWPSWYLLLRKIDNGTVAGYIYPFNPQAPCVLYTGQAFHYTPENAFYIFNQQIYFII